MRELMHKNKAKYGARRVYPYIAYPTDSPKQTIREVCKDNGIGILRLDIKDDNVYVYSNLDAGKEHENYNDNWYPSLSSSDQRSVGNFISKIEQTYLNKIVKDPEKMWRDLIEPGLREYREKHK